MDKNVILQCFSSIILTYLVGGTNIETKAKVTDTFPKKWKVGYWTLDAQMHSIGTICVQFTIAIKCKDGVRFKCIRSESEKRKLLKLHRSFFPLSILRNRRQTHCRFAHNPQPYKKKLQIIKFPPFTTLIHLTSYNLVYMVTDSSPNFDDGADIFSPMVPIPPFQFGFDLQFTQRYMFRKV